MALALHRGLALLLGRWRREEKEQREKQRQREAGYAADQVRAAEEAALAAQHAGGGQHQRLLPAEAVGVVVVLHRHCDLIAGVEIHLDPPVQLPERRQRRRSHPHHQILLLAQLSNSQNCIAQVKQPKSHKSSRSRAVHVSSFQGKKERERKKGKAFDKQASNANFHPPDKLTDLFGSSVPPPTRAPV